MSKSVKITGIHAVDNKGGKEAEFRHLRRELVEVIQDQTIKYNNTDQKIWGLKTPLRWLKLEADLIHQLDTAKSRNISRKEVRKMAASYAILGEEVDSFLAFYHAMGDFVHYQEEELRDFILVTWMDCG